MTTIRKLKNMMMVINNHFKMTKASMLPTIICQRLKQTTKTFSKAMETFL